jgi:hypothetical protein
VAGLVEIAFFHLVVVDLAGQEFVEAGEVGVQVVGKGDVLKCAVQQLFRSAAHDPAERAVYPHKAAFEADQRHADGGIFKRAAETFLAFAQLCLGFFEVMDIRAGAKPLKDGAIGVSERFAANQPPSINPV